MKQSFLSEIAKSKLCTTGDTILLAVSGGIDSMVMLHLFMECGFNIAVAHANFQLRGKESDGDEEFVEAICKKNSIRFFTKKFETTDYAKENHLSIQMAARELRYSWFNDLLTDNHFDLIATAHHLNDSIETVLLNLVRGSGLEGLDGIATRNGKVIRPLLFATRLELENYGNENKIKWREDRSNAADHYPRNFIRHQIYPSLKLLNPSLEKTFAESTYKIAGAIELMEMGIEQWRTKFEIRKGDQVLFNKKGFAGTRNVESVLWNLIKGFGFNFDQCSQIATALHGQSGKRFNSSHYGLVIDRDCLIISTLQKALPQVLIHIDQANASFGNLRMRIARMEKAEFKNDSLTAILDPHKLKFPLLWRKWCAGDSFHPLGMTHKKKLSDFLIDKKIPLPDKENVTVLESGNEIVWVVGHRVDDRFKATGPGAIAIVCHLSTVD